MSRVHFVTCSTCEGSGMVMQPGMFREVEETCPACQGEGQTEDDDADRQIDALDMTGLDPWGHEK